MNIKKVRGSFWDAVLYIGIATLVFIVFLSLVILLGLLFGSWSFSSVFAEQILALAIIFMALVLGILFGLFGFFLIKEIKIEFDPDVAHNPLKLKKNHYNLLFLNWLQGPLRRLGTVSVDEYMLFVKDKLFGYYRGKEAQGTGKHQNHVKKPTWDEICFFARALLDDKNKYYYEARDLIQDWIRDRKREEIKW
jgi:hypothetical protein